jgi:hypothetical protein
VKNVFENKVVEKELPATKRCSNAAKEDIFVN